MVRIVTEITGVGEDEARKLLEESNWSIRDAVQRHSEN
jgi:N-acetylmuramic acid 6-phosphate (MurNAc-6-P) etherase